MLHKLILKVNKNLTSLRKLPMLESVKLVPIRPPSVLQTVLVQRMEVSH